MSTVLEGEIVVHRKADGAVVIEQVPPRARISLELLAAADPHLFRVTGRTIAIAGQVVYRVVEWDALQSALVVELVEDLRART